jgi:hypothetical protein
MAASAGVSRGEPIFRKEECSPFDIGLVLNGVSSFTDAEKMEFIDKIWSPRSDRLFEFPTTVEHGKRVGFLW